MRYHKFVPFLVAAFLALAFSTAHAQTVLISEFMASNDKTLPDEDNAYSDWLELYNPGDLPVNLDGWYLTNVATNKTKWRIPAITLPSKGFKVIFCSKKNRTDPLAPLHTNFKLTAAGDYIGLIKPDGATVVSEFAPLYPPQQTDVSYGMAFSGPGTTLLAPGAPAKAIVPKDATLGSAWIQPSFNDSAWRSGTTGIGYERASGYESLIGLDVGTEMYNITPTVYIRIPFDIPSPAAIDKLTLRMKYDDGFVAWLNGTLVASANAPDTLSYNSPAAQNHDDSLSLVYQDFDITAAKSALKPGTNLLAIQGLNVNTGSSDLLFMPEIIATTGNGVNPGIIRYFTTPTPGAPNGTGTADQGPIVGQIAFTPAEPGPGQSITVTARVAPQFNPLSSVTLAYRVNYGSLVTLPMFDDGAHGDGAAEDGYYGATIPSSAFSAGQMVRWYVTATDSAAKTGRYPLFANAEASPEFLGTVVRDTVTSQLPVLWWFVENPGAAETDTGTHSSIYYNGVFYDNVHTRLRGQTSAYWPKKHFKFDMNGGFNFVYDAAKPSVTEFNLQSTFSDKSYIRSILAWETYAAAGVPGCDNFPIRVQQNGAFYSVGSILEQPSAEMLTRNGLDADGALYKMYSDASNIDGVEKKTRQTEDNSDLLAFIAGLPSTGTALTTFLFDNLNVPEAINYVAATCIMHDNDHVGKNYYLYRNTDGTGEWSILPWDKDLTFGRNYVPWDGGVLADVIWAATDPYSHPFFGDASHPKVDGPWNRVIDAILREPTIRAMYLRRLRTLMDDQLQAPGTPAAALKFEARIDALYAKMAADVLLDRAKWGNPYGLDQDFPTAIGILRTQYLAPRRVHLYSTHSAVDGLIPPAQTTVPKIVFGPMETEPASGNQDEEYLTLQNTGTSAADISGWTLSQDITFTFAPGTVIPAGGKVYVSPRVSLFRKRAVAPKGGEGLFVVGDYHGHLKAVDGSVALHTSVGALVAQTGFTMHDVSSALSIAGGATASDGASLERLNTVAGGGVNLLDAAAILRKVTGLDG